MPSKYRIRNYQEDSFYHIYNRGIGKSQIFLDEKDYEKFLYYLEVYLSPPNNPKHPKLPKRLKVKNLSGDIELIAYLLLPDHFHLILKQKSKTGVSKLLKQLTNAYTYYFNNKYDSSGPLFAGKFKSIKVPQTTLITLTHYIHTHPGILWLAETTKSYPWSSHHEYLQTKEHLVSKKSILSQFPNLKDYEKFIQEKRVYPSSIIIFD